MSATVGHPDAVSTKNTTGPAIDRILFFLLSSWLENLWHTPRGWNILFKKAHPDFFCCFWSYINTSTPSSASVFGSKKSFIEEKVYREKWVSGHIRNALVQLGAVASVWIARVKGVGNTARNACLTISSHQIPTLWPTRMGHPDTLAKTVNATPQVSTPVNVNEHSQTSSSSKSSLKAQVKIHK